MTLPPAYTVMHGDTLYAHQSRVLSKTHPKQCAQIVDMCMVVWCAGRHLSQLPVDAGVGKLLVLGAALGCLSTCLTVAACLSYRTPFASSPEQQDAAGRVRQAMAAPGCLPSHPVALLVATMLCYLASFAPCFHGST